MKRSKQTLVPVAIVNSFSPSQRIALIRYFPLEVNGGRFLSLLVAIRNTATCRHSEIKQNRSMTKQEFSGEAFSKQNIEDWLTSLSCSSSQATTEWSAIFAFGVLLAYIWHPRDTNMADTNLRKACDVTWNPRIVFSEVHNDVICNKPRLFTVPYFSVRSYM